MRIILFSNLNLQLTSHGGRFWSGAKRCPNFLTFDGSNREHVQFVLAAAFLRAQMYNLTPTVDFNHVAQVASTIEPVVFVPKGVKIAVVDSEIEQHQNETTVG